MTWSYSPGFLIGTGVTSNLYKVRRAVGDVLTLDQQLSDEEIYYALNYESSPTLAAASAADMIAGLYARQINTQNSLLRSSAEARMKHYTELADRLRAGGAGDIPGDPNIIQATMYVGGSSVAAKEAITGDSDTVQQPFALGQDDMPGLGSSATAGF